MPRRPVDIRPLGEDDIRPCIRLYQEAYATPPYGHGWDDEISERIIRDLLRLFPRECFVAVRRGEVVGFILCSSLADLRATVEEFAVAPAHQGEGIGDALLGHVTRTYRARGVPFLELVANRHAPAYGFYLRRGFAETQEYRLMTKEL